MHLIYKITNKLNGKIYIGQKSYVDKPSMSDYYGGGVEIKRAIKKYFAENGCHNKGRKMSDEQRKKQSEAQKKRFSNMDERARTSRLTKEAMSNEDIRKKLSSSLKDYYKRTGNKPMTTAGKKWYNNGEKSGFFVEGEQPEGWIKGRLKRK